MRVPLHDTEPEIRHLPGLCECSPLQLDPVKSRSPTVQPDAVAEGEWRYVDDELVEDVLVDALRRELNDTLEVAVPEAGMHLVAWLPPDVDGGAASYAAAAHGLHIEPVSHFSARLSRRTAGRRASTGGRTPVVAGVGVQHSIRLRPASDWRRCVRLRRSVESAVGRTGSRTAPPR